MAGCLKLGHTTLFEGYQSYLAPQIRDVDLELFSFSFLIQIEEFRSRPFTSYAITLIFYLYSKIYIDDSDKYQISLFTF